MHRKYSIEKYRVVVERMGFRIWLWGELDSPHVKILNMVSSAVFGGWGGLLATKCRALRCSIV